MLLYSDEDMALISAGVQITLRQFMSHKSKRLKLKFSFGGYFSVLEV